MKKSIKIVLTVAFLTSLTGCAYYGSSSSVLEDNYSSSLKIKEDMDKVSAAIRVASINHNAANADSSDKIKGSLVTDGILIEYPSFGGHSYKLKSVDGNEASFVKDVSFVTLDKKVSKGVCEEVNRQSNINDIVKVDSETSQIEKYYAVVSKNNDVKNVSKLPKTVCYELTKEKGNAGYEVASLVSRVSLLKGA